MDYNNYIHKLVQSFRDNRFAKFMFIKHYETLLISQQELIESMIDETSSWCFLIHAFPMHSMQAPYSPFLEWICSLYYRYFTDETPEEFVQHAGVYSLQQSIFVSYIRTGVAERSEDILISEVAYERKRMLQSMVNIYIYISKRIPIFIILEKMHLATASCVQFIYELLRCDKVRNIQVLAMYNEVYRIPEYILKDWKCLIKELEHQNLQYEWGSVNPNMEVSTIDVQDVFLPNADSMEQYLNYLNNYYFFLGIEDAKNYMDVMTERMRQGTLHISGTYAAIFYELFTLILLMDQRYPQALQVCENLEQIAREQNDDKLRYNYYYLLAQCRYGMEQLENKVDFYVNQCCAIAKAQGDELAEYKAEILRILSKFNYWRDVFNPCDNNYQVPERFFEQTERFGFQNMLAHMYVFCVKDGEEALKKIEEGEAEQTCFKKGIAIAQKLDNQDFLLDAYSKNIVLFGEYGYQNTVECLYQKKLEVVEKGGNLLQKVHTYNGIGYNAAILEHYQKAEEYFGKSLSYALKLKDKEEVAITLYNCAVNKMLVREFEAAIDDLNLLLQVMDLLHMHSIKICDTSRIYGMLGLCSLYNEEEYRCYLCLNRISAYVRHLQYIEDPERYKYWHDTLFFEHMIKAMLNYREEKFDLAQQEFAKAEFHMKKEKSSQYLNYPLYVVELAKFYKVCGRLEQREEILDAGIAFCRENGYRLHQNFLMKMQQNRTEKLCKTPIARRELSNAQVLEQVENMALQCDLEMNQKDIDFIVIWQELLNQDVGPEEMTSQAIGLMKNYFNLDGVFILNNQHGKVQPMYFDGPETNGNNTIITDCIRNFTQQELGKLRDYFQRHKRPLLVNRIDKGFLEYEKLLKIFDINHIITLFAFPLLDGEGKVISVLIGYVEMHDNYIGNRYLLMEHDFTILKFFCSQFYIALKRLEYLELINRMNSQLSDMAVTDLLTGLYNRQGFEKKIQEDSLQKKGKSVILYIDLDNFKYYNDTFGHEIGDYVLVRFAQLLERVVDDCGYAVRYGGDEFVLVIDGHDVSFGKKIAKNIFFMMQDGLNGAIEKRIGGEVSIPKDKLLSCSIGIAGFEGYDNKQVQEALNKADKGLYYVKRKTKGSFVVWDELKDKQKE